MPKILLGLVVVLLPLEAALSQNLPGCLFKNHVNALGRIQLKYKTIDNEPKTRNGTGFIISPDGLLLTARHVVSTEDGEDLESLRVTFGKNEYDAVVEGQDKDLDVALVQLEREQNKEWSTVPVNKSPQVDPGDTVVALGFPAGFDATVTSPAVVSALNSRFGAEIKLWWQTSLDLYEGMSGGPVFDSSGAVVGMAIGRHTALSAVSYVLPAAKIGDFLDKAPDLADDRPCREVEIRGCRVCFKQASGTGCPGQEASCSVWSDTSDGSPELPTADGGWSGVVRVRAGASAADAACDLKWKIECR